jgi:2-methylcitrate dehydratase PrpD
MTVSNGEILAQYVTGAHSRTIPPEVLDMSRFSLVDWVGVSIGATSERTPRAVANSVKGWTTGKSTVLLGGMAVPAVAALCNGALAHGLDFDDIYAPAYAHLGAPLWATTLALGEETGASEEAVLKAFTTGFETAAHLGRGLGSDLLLRGIQGTGVFGLLGSAAASSVLLKLDLGRVQHAMGVAATQVSGLAGAGGTMPKPLQAGRAAMDGILSAQFARSGLEAAADALEPDGTMATAILQDRSRTLSHLEFEDWEILNNSFKCFATSQLTHAAVQAAQGMGLDKQKLDSARMIRVEVGELAMKVAGGDGRRPKSALQAKFDLRYCVAMALHGHAVGADDFRDAFIANVHACATAELIELVFSANLEVHSSRVTVSFSDETSLVAEVRVAKGHPFNPMDWNDMWKKFSALVTPVVGPGTLDLFDSLRQFGGGAAYRSPLATAAAAMRLEPAPSAVRR